MYKIFLLKSEWTAYFAVASYILISIVFFFISKEKNYLFLVFSSMMETLFSLCFYVCSNIYVVGFQNFKDTMLERFSGRSRAFDYSVKEFIGAQWASFGLIWIILITLFVFFLFSKDKTKYLRGYKGIECVIFILSFPLLENIVFMNHALTYSMDRMKWFFVLQFFLIILWEKIQINKCLKPVCIYLLVGLCIVNVGLYTFFDNEYIHKEKRLDSNYVIEQYIEENYSDSVIGQFGGESVWGYSKLLFGKGIEKNASIDSLTYRRHLLGRKYSVGLNAIDLGYSQMLFTSAVIFDDDLSKVIGVVPNQFLFKCDDLYYLNFTEKVIFYENSFDNVVETFELDECLGENEKKKVFNEHIEKYDLSNNTIYFEFELVKNPNIVTANYQTINEWINGVSPVRNQIIFLNTPNTADLLKQANVLKHDEVVSEISSINIEGDFIFIELVEEERDNLQYFMYPNMIEVY